MTTSIVLSIVEIALLLFTLLAVLYYTLETKRLRLAQEALLEQGEENLNIRRGEKERQNELESRKSDPYFKITSRQRDPDSKELKVNMVTSLLHVDSLDVKALSDDVEAQLRKSNRAEGIAWFELVLFHPEHLPNHIRLQFGFDNDVGKRRTRDYILEGKTLRELP